MRTHHAFDVLLHYCAAYQISLMRRKNDLELDLAFEISIVSVYLGFHTDHLLSDKNLCMAVSTNGTAFVPSHAWQITALISVCALAFRGSETDSLSFSRSCLHHNGNTL